MEEILVLITGLISGFISAVITYFATRSKVRLELIIEYDKQLRAERLDAYKLLWKELKPLSRYSAENKLTYEIICETTEKMRDWYFDTGGIYLSKKSREPYFKMKDLMQIIIDDDEWRSKKDEPLERNLKKEILKQGRTLRESLSDDIGTRREPFI